MKIVSKMKGNMVKTVVVFVVSLFLLNQDVKAQSFDNIINAIKSGNASALAANFESNVEITIKSSANSYSKSQAEMVLKNFFNSNQPKSFAVIHQGTSPEGSKYFIGNLTTSTGTYRAYVYAKTLNGKLVIQEIRFEE